MAIFFFVFASLLVYTFLGYPVILWLLSLLIGKNPDKADIFPTVSLIVSAYNEESIIKEKILNCLELDYPKDKLEIIVASESNDKTNNIVKEYQLSGIVLHSFPGRQGKASTLFRTVPKANGEIIVFSDANAIYKKDAIKKLVRNFNDSRIGCVSGQLKYSNPDKSASGSGEGLYWKYEMRLKKLESRVFSLLGANGSIFAIRKKLYLPMTQERGDDFELPIRIRQQEYGVVLEPQAVSWEKSTSTAKEEFNRKVRIIAWNMKSCSLLIVECLRKKKVALVFQLVSHKFLRWLFPIFAMGMLVTNIFLAGLFFRVLLLAQVFFYVSAFIGYVLDMKRAKVPRILIVPYYFCLIHVAAIAGMYRLMCGGQKTVWQKVRT